mmetsp:Transcript_13665/g.29325  ORF Transcript_13665/g.29325 Transcript_13665/m.29325 type:complete len:277 (-) Transcript_13665:615-1445(-)
MPADTLWPPTGSGASPPAVRAALMGGSGGPAPSLRPEPRLPGRDGSGPAAPALPKELVREAPAKGVLLPDEPRLLLPMSFAPMRPPLTPMYGLAVPDSGSNAWLASCRNSVSRYSSPSSGALLGLNMAGDSRSGKSSSAAFLLRLSCANSAVALCSSLSFFSSTTGITTGGTAGLGGAWGVSILNLLKLASISRAASVMHRSSGVCLRSFSTSCCAPMDSSSSMTVRWFMKHARCRGVFPSFVLVAKEAPSLTSMLTAAFLPLYTARCRAVHPELF